MLSESQGIRSEVGDRKLCLDLWWRLTEVQKCSPFGRYPPSIDSSLESAASWARRVRADGPHGRFIIFKNWKWCWEGERWSAATLAEAAFGARKSLFIHWGSSWMFNYTIDYNKKYLEASNGVQMWCPVQKPDMYTKDELTISRHSPRFQPSWRSASTECQKLAIFPEKAPRVPGFDPALCATLILSFIRKLDLSFKKFQVLCFL